MTQKLTYEELEQRVKELENQLAMSGQAEEELKKTDVWLYSLFNSLEEAVFLVTPDRKLANVNDAAERMFGYSREEVRDLSTEALHVDHEHYLEFGRRINQAFEEHKTASFEFEVKRKNGEIFPTVHTVSLLQNERGEPLGIVSIVRDTSERKRAEAEQLVQSEIARNLSEGIYLIRVSDGVILYTNPKFEKMFGYDPGELVGKHVSTVNAPTEKRPQEIADEIIQSLKESGMWSGEVENIKKDGTRFWCHANVSTFDHHDFGEVWVSVHEDITERKRAEEALRESEEKYKTLVESSLTGIFIHQDGKYVFVNDRFAEIHGYESEELLGGEYLSLIHPDERDALAQRVLDRVKGEAVPQRYEVRRLGKDGKAIPCEMMATRIEYEGKPAIMGNILDITERKRAEEALRDAHDKLERRVEERSAELVKANAQLRKEIGERKRAEEELRESETQYRETLDAMGDWILVVDPDLRIVLFNAAFMHISKQLGLTTDVIGRTPMQVFPFLPDTLLDEYRWVFENKRGLITQETTKVGSREFITESRKIPLLKEGRIVRVISVIRDITEQKSLEAQLRRAQKMEAIGTLAGGVAHDLNNILAGIVSYPDLLLMQIPEDSPWRKPISTMKESGKKAADIVEDLLTLARRGVASTEVTNLNDIISQYLKSPVYQELKLYHPEVEVETNLETDLLHIIGSDVHLSKAVMNLISNAAEAMPDGGKISIITENRYVDRPVRGYDHVEEGDYVTLTVSDSGVGISSEDLGRVFEPFYTKKKMRRSGTGLGMAVVWGTVKDHKGYIDLQSAEGQGTTITLYFPATRQQPIEDQPGLAVEDYMGRGQSILVVDDVKEQREIAFTLLSELGYSVTSVSSGEEAVEYMKSNSVDLLLLDMIMDPGIDGLEAYKQILELYPRQKAIIVSGFSETDRVKEAQRLGAGQYIKKPFILQKIGIVVKAELEK